MFSVRAPSCSGLLRAAPKGFCSFFLYCPSGLRHSTASAWWIWWWDQISWVYCEAIVSLLALMILMITRVHILWCPGVNIKCNLNAGSQKRDVDALRSLSWRQSSWRHPGWEQVKSLWNCRFKVLGIHWGSSLSYLYIYIDIHYSTWWYMNIFGTLCFCLESWCF